MIEWGQSLDQKRIPLNFYFQKVDEIVMRLLQGMVQNMNQISRASVFQFVVLVVVFHLPILQKVSEKQLAGIVDSLAIIL